MGFNEFPASKFSTIKQMTDPSAMGFNEFPASKFSAIKQMTDPSANS